MNRPFARSIALALALLLAAAAWLSMSAARADVTLYTKAKIKLFKAKDTDSQGAVPHSQRHRPFHRGKGEKLVPGHL